MLYVPRHLPNRLEYKVLSCISVHYQSRMTSLEVNTVTRDDHSDEKIPHHEVGWSPLRTHPINVRG